MADRRMFTTKHPKAGHSVVVGGLMDFKQKCQKMSILKFIDFNNVD